MEPVMLRIQKALRKEFSSKDILLEDAGDGFVGGWVISKSFEGLDGAQRQKRVWSLFDKYLDEQDRDRLAVFLTFTPIERKEIFDDDIGEKPLKKKSLSAGKKTMAVGRKNGGVRQKRN